MPSATLSIPTVHPAVLKRANRILAMNDGDSLVAEAKVLATAIVGLSSELDQLEAQLNAVLVPGMKIGEVRKSSVGT